MFFTAGTLPPVQPDASAQRDQGLLELLSALEEAQIALYEAILTTFDDAAFASDFPEATARESVVSILEVERSHLAALGGSSSGPPPAVEPGRLTTARQSLEEAVALENLVVAAYAGVIPEIRRRRVLRLLIGIHSVEARQAALLATFVDSDPTPQVIDEALSPAEVVARLSGTDQNEATTPPATPVDDALAPGIAAIAGELGVGVDDVSVVSARPRDWPNSALGCPRPGEVYAEVITPGYELMIEVNGEQMEFHTDMRGNAVRCP